MASTVYKPIHVITKNSKIYGNVTATIRGSYLLYADELAVNIFCISSVSCSSHK